MIRAILFDIGNVLLRFDFHPALEKMGRRSGLGAQEVLARTTETRVAYEGGRIGRREFLDRITREIGFDGPEEELIRAWQEIFTENHPMTALVKAWHGRMPFYLLSNTNDLHIEYIRATYSVFALIPEGIYSWEARAMKPEPAIYGAAIDRFGLEPSETLFIDDMAPNVEGGRRAGLQCIQYNPDEHARALDEFRALRFEC